MLPTHCELWIAFQDEPTVRLARSLEAWLDADERRRADRYRRQQDSDLFVLAHVMLRDVLSRHAATAPESLRFTAAPGGKPCLAGASLEFNLSHTCGAVIAAVGTAPLGVDIEREDRRTDLGVARRFFSDPEQRRLFSLEIGEQRAEFFRIWTLKEAWLKAKGVGLAEPLDAFAVFGDDPSQVASVRLLEGDAPESVDYAWLRTARVSPVGPLTVAPRRLHAPPATDSPTFRWSLAVLARETEPATYALKSWPEN